ncbi:Isoaspartyl peptidase precursor [Serratia fonticola]|uniref:Isoaspartyl peptidase n=1 Tax=Serratia fonticola TaxID=47917 RepID=A0A4V6KJX4_SERFO|nr:Isoaspartyl peptidase precursor [Serratia fonticola]
MPVLTLQQACDKVVMEKLLALGGSGGLIAIDRFGNVALPFNSEGMYRRFRLCRRCPFRGYLPLNACREGA